MYATAKDGILTCHWHHARFDLESGGRSTYSPTTCAPFRAGLSFGTRYRWRGWGQGLAILACLMNLLPYLDEADRPRKFWQRAALPPKDFRCLASNK